MTFLFLAPLLLGRPLWPPSCLPFLAPIDFLADFIALPTALRVNILTSFRRVCLTSALAGVVLYFHLFAPHVLLDDLPLVDDVFANADLLFGHRLFLDHDLVLDYRHGYFVGAYLGLRRVVACRYSLDAYLLPADR